MATRGQGVEWRRDPLRQASPLPAGGGKGGKPHPYLVRGGGQVILVTYIYILSKMVNTMYYIIYN